MAKALTAMGAAGSGNRWVPAAWRIKRGALPSSWRTPAVVVCRIRSLRLSGWCRRRPKPGNKHQVDEFQKCADIRMRYLGVATPTSTTVGVTRLAGPDFMIEIEAVAIVNS